MKPFQSMHLSHILYAMSQSEEKIPKFKTEDNKEVRSQRLTKDCGVLVLKLVESYNPRKANLQKYTKYASM